MGVLDSLQFGDARKHNASSLLHGVVGGCDSPHVGFPMCVSFPSPPPPYLGYTVSLLSAFPIFPTCSTHPP